MRSSRSRLRRAARGLSALVLLVAAGGVARAQPIPAGGYANDRPTGFAGGGWLLVDALEMQGGFGGIIGFNLEYAHLPLVVGQGSERLSPVEHWGGAMVSLAFTVDRYRLSLDLPVPLVVQGQSGVVGGYAFTGPNIDPASHPDLIGDAHLGFDARIAGAPGGLFRFGAGGELIVPNGAREDYTSDGTFRGQLRLLFAGDYRLFTWAAMLALHIRPLDEPAPGSPRGSELQLAVAAGARIGLGTSLQLVIGPELWASSPFAAFLSSGSRPFEALLSARLEGEAGPLRWRARVAGGAGLLSEPGAPEWRVVIGAELYTFGVRR